MARPAWAAMCLPTSGMVVTTVRPAGPLREKRILTGVASRTFTTHSASIHGGT